MTPQAKKMTFFRIFFFCCTSSRRDETFLLLPKFHIFSRSEKSGGDKEKALHQRTTTTNDDNERRQRTTTTNYIDDDKTPSGFFQNPRANKYVCVFTKTDQSLLSARVTGFQVSSSDSPYSFTFSTCHRSSCSMLSRSRAFHTGTSTWGSSRSCRSSCCCRRRWTCCRTEPGSS